MFCFGLCCFGPVCFDWFKKQLNELKYKRIKAIILIKGIN